MQCSDGGERRNVQTQFENNCIGFRIFEYCPEFLRNSWEETHLKSQESITTTLHRLWFESRQLECEIGNSESEKEKVD